MTVKKDQRDVLVAEDNAIPEPARNLPPLIKTKFREVTYLIKNCKKARSALTYGDYESILNVAVSMALQRQLMEQRFGDEVAKMDYKTISSIDRRLLQVGADIRQGLDKLLLNPNARARVVIDTTKVEAIEISNKFMPPV